MKKNSVYWALYYQKTYLMNTTEFLFQQQQRFQQEFAKKTYQNLTDVQDGQ